MTRTSLLDRRVLTLALPAAGSAILPLIHRAVDQLWLTRVSDTAISALTTATVSVWMHAGISLLASMGLGALVARYSGAGRQAGAAYVGSQGLRWSAALGLVAGVVGFACSDLLFDAAEAPDVVREAGLPYAQIYWVGGVFVLLQMACDAIWRGHGNTRVPLLVGFASLLVNVVADPLFIFGFGPVPAMGVAGAGLATILAGVIGMSLNVWLLRRAGHLRAAHPGDEELRLRADTRLSKPRLLGLDSAIFVRMTRVGIPSSCASLFFNVIILVILRYAQEVGGEAATAALGVGYTMEGVAWVLGMGWAAASSALVGRYLGAEQPEEAERLAWTAGAQCGALCGLWALVLFFFNETLARAFLDDPASIEMAASYAQIVALCLVPQTFDLVLSGAFGGAGMTVPPTIVGLSFNALRIPLIPIAAFDMGLGVEGIWWVVAVTSILRGVFIAAWFSLNTWKTRSV